MTKSTISTLFGIAGVYDFGIGIVFLFFGTQLFDLSGIPHPNHWGYVQFCSLMLMVFGSMFLAIAREPVSNRNLMPFGMLLKISYAGLVCFYWLTTGCPFLFKPFVVIDLGMLVLFAMAFIATAQRQAAVGSRA
jgi:hypothetical protein